MPKHLHNRRALTVGVQTQHQLGMEISLRNRLWKFPTGKQEIFWGIFSKDESHFIQQNHLLFNLLLNDPFNMVNSFPRRARGNPMQEQTNSEEESSFICPFTVH